MRLWSTLFGSTETVNKIADGVYDGLDAVVYTKEEEERDNITKSELKIRLLQAYEPFKVAQRLLSLVVGIPFVLLWAVIGLSWLICIGYFGFQEPVMNEGIMVVSPQYHFITSQLKTLGALNNQTLGEPFSIIIAFYFLGGAGEGMIKAYVNRKTQAGGQ